MWEECTYDVPVRATDDFKTVDGILRWAGRRDRQG